MTMSVAIPSDGAVNDIGDKIDSNLPLGDSDPLRDGTRKVLKGQPYFVRGWF